MTEMFGEAWPPMSVPDLAPDDDDMESGHPTVSSPQNTTVWYLNSVSF